MAKGLAKGININYLKIFRSKSNSVYLLTIFLIS